MHARNANSVHVLAGVLAWAWPGLGHIQRGEHRRGRLIMLGVLLLVATGVLIGGIDAVDHRNDGLWFAAQVMCGPIVIALDFANQAWIKTLELGDRSLLVGLGHVNEIGMLYIGMAGLMNFVAMLDALSPKRLGDLERRGEESPA